MHQFLLKRFPLEEAGHLFGEVWTSLSIQMGYMAVEQ